MFLLVQRLTKVLLCFNGGMYIGFLTALCREFKVFRDESYINKIFACSIIDPCCWHMFDIVWSYILPVPNILVNNEGQRVSYVQSDWCTLYYAQYAEIFNIMHWNDEIQLWVKHFQCLRVVYWIIRNTLQWILHQNRRIFVEQNVFKYVVWKMTTLCKAFNELTDKIHCFPFVWYLHVFDRLTWLHLSSSLGVPV